MSQVQILVWSVKQLTSTISKILSYKTLSLEVLRGKVLGIDVMPILYKYLFTTGQDQDVLRTSTGLVTGHVKGLLYFLKNLKKHQITPVICLDVHHPRIKNEAVLKRIESRKRGISKYQLMTSNGIELNARQKRSLTNLKHVVGPNEKKLVLDLLEPLGVTTYRMDYVEGQKSCAGLKKLGLVDEVYSADRDLVLYSTSFYNNLDFKAGTVRYYDYESILKELGVSSQQMTLACIATGTDYSKGIPRVGPKTVFKLMRNSPEFLNKLAHHVPNYKQILEYISNDISIDPCFLVKGKKDPIAFTKMLQQLEFNSAFVLSISTYLY